MACTAITIVRLLESRQKVMKDEKIILGEKWNSIGQLGVARRRYVYAINRAENVSASEMMNSHIPNFFELTANGDAPPLQFDSVMATFASGVKVVYPQTKNKTSK